MSLIWFRNDLRLLNNPALFEACNYSITTKSHTVGLVVISAQEWNKILNWGLPKADYYWRTVKSLQEDLAQKNISLIIKSISLPDDEFTPKGYYESMGKEIVSLCRKLNCETIFMNKEYEATSLERDRIVTRLFDENGICHHSSHDQCAVQVGKVLTNAGTPYKVFSQFKRTWAKYIDNHSLTIIPEPTFPTAKVESSPNKDLPDLPWGYKMEDFPHLDLKYLRENWVVGESAASACLEKFLTVSSTYSEDRNHGGGSRLSAPLSVGAISSSQCLRAAMDRNKGKLLSGDAGLVCWINELCWRDFYRHVLFHFPHVGEGKSFRGEYENLPWRGWERGEMGNVVEDEFSRWCTGTTGVPIVDAAMRELNRTGWMDNRLRMVVAMYLTKDLLIHWRRGERYFATHLVDYDFSNNNGGWQWSASTGTDSQPYFRVFNPVLQSEKYDPNGEFLRSSIKELENVKAPFIHAPWERMKEKEFEKLNYPRPIIDHQIAKGKVLAMFTAASPPTTKGGKRPIDATGE